MNQKKSHRPQHPVAALLAVVSVSVAGLLTGCAAGLSGAGDTTATSTVVPATLTGAHGAVHGGQFPITAATVQMYTVGTSGNASAATPLIGTTVTTSDGTSTTDSNANAGNLNNTLPAGNFTVSGLYTCPTGNPGALTYMVASQGNPGLTAPGANNTYIILMAALGPCNTLATNFPFISLDEVTTVASVYALASFMSDTAHIGAASTNSTGITNAFLTANNLAAISTGTSPSLSLPATSTVPVSEIYTLADIIATCVNSSGTDGTCASLVSQTTAGSVTAVDTATAVLGIVKNPTNNAAALFNNFVNSQAPFQPNLVSAPSDWSVAVKSTGAGISGPTGIAIDASGNAWIANSGGTAITELSPVGAALSGSTGYTGVLGPQSLAIDTTGHVWIANSYGGNVVEMSSTGSILASGITAGGITSPYGIAVDNSNNVWVTNFNESTVSGITSAGAALSGSPFTAATNLNAPTGIAIDSANNVWVSNSGSNTITELSNAGTNLSGAGYTDGAILAPGGLAINKLSTTLVADAGLNAASVFGGNGVASSSSPVGPLSIPVGVATDGANAAWITNGGTSGSLSYLVASGTSPVALGSLNAPAGVAVDSSGNVWTANSGDDSVSQFVGLATAVTTPLVNRFQ